MGYVTSATTVYLDLHLSELGREYLLTGGLSDRITTFALGDPDADYRNPNRLTTGYMPDVTGSHNNCIFGVNNGYDIQHKLIYYETASNVVGSSPLTSNVAFGFKNTNGGYDYTDNASVVVYLHDYLVNLKGMAHSVVENHTWSGLASKVSGFTNYFSGVTNDGGKTYAKNTKELYYQLDDKGRGLFLDFVDMVAVSKGGNYEFHDIEFKPETNKDLKLLEKLTGAVYVDQGTKTETGRGAMVGGRRKTVFESPWTVVSDSYVDRNGKSYGGAGKFGISLYSHDFGYLASNVTENSSKYYNEFGFNNNSGGFYHPAQLENTSFINNLQSSGLKNVFPSARILNKTNLETNFYYPLSKKQLEANYKENNYKASEGSSYLGGTGPIESTSALETYINFAAGTPEYIVGQAKGGYEKSLKINWLNNTSEPMTLLTRQLSNVDNFFYGLKKDAETANFVTYSGTTNHYTVNFKVNLLAYSRTDSKTKPARISINFVLDKGAMTDSITFENSTATTPARYKIFDNENVKFYGADYADKSGYATSPLKAETSNSGKLFRKITYSSSS